MFKHNVFQGKSSSRLHKWSLVGLFAAMILSFAACQSATPTFPPSPAQTEAPITTESPTGNAEAEPIPAVVVNDQEIVDGKVVVSEAISKGPGWIVIHGQKDGKPGAILGYSEITDGVNENIMVEIDAATATETLYAMLHIDAGEVG